MGWQDSMEIPMIPTDGEVLFEICWWRRWRDLDSEVQLFARLVRLAFNGGFIFLLVNIAYNSSTPWFLELSFRIDKKLLRPVYLRPKITDSGMRAICRN